jgi:hypothetical protein
VCLPNCLPCHYTLQTEIVMTRAEIACKLLSAGDECALRFALQIAARRVYACETVTEIVDAAATLAR